MSISPPTNIIMKVTRKCNFRCEYCHDVQDQGSNMPFEVLATTIKRVLDQKQKSTFRFIWHGGEPLLLGHRFFLKVVALQNEFRTSDQIITNNLQTNGYLIDERYVDFFDQFRFTIGISMDGPPGLHDSQRSRYDGTSTFKKVVQAISLLRARNIVFGVLTVLTPRSLQTRPDVLLGFYRQHGVSSVGFLPVRSDCHLRGETLQPDAYARYMTALFDEWLRLNDPDFQVREFRDWVFLAAGLPGTQCSSSGSCIGSTFCIEPDGAVYNCDKFVGIDSFRYGTISETDFDNIAGSSSFCALRTWDLSLLDMCQQCNWRVYCAGGCSHDRYLKQLSSSETNFCSLQAILSHVKKRIEHHPLVQTLMQREENEIIPF